MVNKLKAILVVSLLNKFSDHRWEYIIIKSKKNKCWQGRILSQLRTLVKYRSKTPSKRKILQLILLPLRYRLINFLLDRKIIIISYNIHPNRTPLPNQTITKYNSLTTNHLPHPECSTKDYREFNSKSRVVSGHKLMVMGNQFARSSLPHVIDRLKLMRIMM